MKFLFLLLALPILVLIFVNGLVELTNIECNTTDKLYTDFEYCYIRAINRTFKYVSFKAKLFQIPINNVTLRLDLRKRANGYKPFLYNISFDACKFLKSKNNPVVRYFYSFIEKYSNMNHTCPFDHDIILEKLNIAFLNDQVTKLLPFPEGEYAIFTTWSAYNIPRAIVNFFVRLK